MPADHRNSPVGRNSFRSALQAKSRRRREDLTKLAAAAPGSHGARNDLLPRLEMVDVAPADLRLPTRKVRRIEGSHVREVANAISGLGFCDPVLIDEGNVVLDGIVRAEAAKVLGLHRIPCIRASHLSVSERRLVRLALNRLSEKGTWDIDELAGVGGTSVHGLVLCNHPPQAIKLLPSRRSAECIIAMSLELRKRSKVARSCFCLPIPPN